MRRKIAAVFGAGGVLLVTGVLIASFVFEGRVLEMATAELNRDLHATIAYDSASVSWLRKFPSVQLRIEELTVTGKDEFAGIALVAAPQVQVTFDLASVLSGPLTVREIRIVDPHLQVVVDEEGRANYDIWPAEAEEAEATAYHLRIAELTVEGLSADYEDREGGIGAHIEGLDHQTRGDLTEALAALSTHTEIASLGANYGELSLLDDTHWIADVDVDYDLVTGAIGLGDGKIAINTLALGLSGTAVPTDAGWDLDLGFETLDTAFKTLLSIVPSAFTEDFADVDATGSLTLKGTAKGAYHSEDDHLPELDLVLAVVDGRVKYPDLPSAVEEIAADVVIAHPEGPADLTEIDVKRFHLALGGSPLEGALKIRQPTTDPFVASRIKGHLDLGAIGRAWPLEGTEYAGVVRLDLNVSGKISDFQAQAVDRIRAEGSIALEGVRYASADLPVEVLVDELNIALAPERTSITSLRTHFGTSDLSGTGHFENVMPYLAGSAALVGTLDLDGTRVDLEPFEGEDDVEGAEAEEDVLVAVPTDLDLAIEVGFGEVIANGLTFEHVEGLLLVKDGAVRMDGLSLDLLGGHVVMSGAYAAPTADLADIDLELDLVEFDLPKTMGAFPSLARIVPVAANASGRFDSAMLLQGRLLADGTPDLSVLASKGNVDAYKIGLAPAALTAVAEQLMDSKFGTLELDATRLLYEMQDGKIHLQPFEAKLGGVPAVVSGESAVLDQSMDLAMDLTLPTRGLTGAPFLAGVSSSDTVDVRVKLVGPWTSPKVSTDLGGQAKAAVTERVTEVVSSTKSGLVDAASAEGDRLVAAAETQGERLRAEAKKAADRVRREAKTAGEKLVEEAGSNPLAKAAAKETAKKLTTEADKKAKGLEDEADGAAKALVRKAKKEKTRLIDEARKK